MKITGLSVKRTQDGEGHLITVSAFVPSREKLEADDVSRLLDVIRETAGAEPVSRDTKGGLKPASNEEDERMIYEAEGNAPAPEIGTRRRRGTSAASDASAETAPSAPQADATAAPGEAGGRRRRRVSQEAPAEDQGNAAAGASSTSATELPETTASSSGASTRRRRVTPTAPSTEATATTGAAATTATTKSRSEIKDVDLGKAASNAAAKIGTEAVTILVNNYAGDGNKVNQIPAEDRAAFLAELEDLVKRFG